MSPKSWTIAFSVFFVFAALGIGRAISVSNGLAFFSAAGLLANERNPAALKRVFDYSAFEGQPLKVRSFRRLIDDAKIVQQSGGVGIGLGHFVTKGEDGRGVLACDFYGKMTLKFEGEGVLEAGEKPTMTVEAPCAISADINRIDTIWIPFERLVSENRVPPASLEASFPDQKGVYFKFDHLPSEWPRRWTLVSVRLYGDGAPGREVAIDKASMNELITKPLVVTF